MTIKFLININNLLYQHPVESKRINVWFYDYRTNIHHTLKKKPMRFNDLADFIKCYNPKNPNNRKETWYPEKNPEGRWS